MSCAESLRVQAYFDGEVDAVSAIDIERHIEQCVECRSLLQYLEQTRTAIRRHATYDRTPPELRARILRALDQEAAGKSPEFNERGRSTWRTRLFWAGALSGVGGAAVAAVIAFFLLSPSLGNPLLDDLVAAQVRSLMPSHLIDVASTDQHTVKPWFAGHTDVSPLVADFSQQGYRLIGGRADYLDHQRAAVVVYQHGPHVINVFSWSGQRTLLNNTTRNGYRMAFWKAGDLDYCAVSDTGWDELLGLVRLLRDLSAHDAQQ
jgi:anti-sigma factor (TIGR02949 family)